MVLNIAVAIGASIVFMYAIAALLRVVGADSAITTTLLQTIVTASFGYGLFSVGYIGVPIAVILGVLPLFVRGFAMVWFYRQGRKILRGDYGDESMWAAELATEEEDREFIMAANQLTQMEMREAGIESSEKSELRENVVERAKEKQE